VYQRKSPLSHRKKQEQPGKQQVSRRIPPKKQSKEAGYSGKALHNPCKPPEQKNIQPQT